MASMPAPTAEEAWLAPPVALELPVALLLALALADGAVPANPVLVATLPVAETSEEPVAAVAFLPVAVAWLPAVTVLLDAPEVEEETDFAGCFLHVKSYRGALFTLVPPMIPKDGSGVVGMESSSVYHQVLYFPKSAQPTSCQ